MTDLANRPYWTRFWVLQEFLLGRDVLTHCSNNILDWQDFQDMVCRCAGIDQYSSAYDRKSTNGFLAMPLVMGRHPDKHPKLLQPLDSLLVSFHRMECKDPRDRIFALLGLVTAEERDLLGRAFPDYTMTEDHVRIVALAHVTQCGHMVTRLAAVEAATTASDELFLGLGAKSSSERARLLRRAQGLDYLGFQSGAELRSILAMYDSDEEYGRFDEESGLLSVHEPDNRTSSRGYSLWGKIKFFTVWVVIIGVIWLGRGYISSLFNFLSFLF
ncbi:hypothetical protein BX600DRAFT_226847 [Xylariales sp. PMI_506]|nr:hypothetical protein BX600DRAFT_226847 [Xylariales sp. PMI_506]